MAAAPRKPPVPPADRNIYGKINNLLSTQTKAEIEKIRAELEESRRELYREAEEVRRDAEQMRRDLRNQVASQQQTIQKSVESLYDSFYGSGVKDYHSTMAKKAAGKPKQKKTITVDRRVTNNDISTYTPETHNVRVSTKITHRDRENGTRKIIGMDTVEWWEYILVYGFFKATKIAYEYNIVKDLIKNPEHIVSLVNKGALVLTFIPKKNDEKQSVERNSATGEDEIILTGTIYREIQLTIEIPYKTGKRTEEKKNGFFLYEETYDSLEPDYEELGRKLAQELNEKKINEGFKTIIANEIENGRISRI